MESVDPKINASLWLCNMKKKMTIFLKIKGRNKAQWGEKLCNLKRDPTGEFVIVVKFGDHVLCRLASSLSNVIRQVSRQTKFQFT